MIAGAALVVVFLLFAGLMYTRKLSALLAVPAMAVAMSIVAGVKAPALGAVVVTGAASLAPVYVAVIFGALLGRVTLDTGIARAIVNFAAEFGSENPLVTTLVLCAIVALLFVSLSGLGAIIMVGSIVLPILMTTGVPRKIAATVFLMAFALGYIFNIVNWKFYTQYFGVSAPQMYRYAIVLAAIDAVALIGYALLSFARAKDYATWAVKSEKAGGPNVPWYAVITPVLPIALYFVLHLDAILAFGVSALYGALTTRPARAVQTLTAAAIRGIEDVAPAIMLFVGIGMLLTATKQPEFAAAMRPIVASRLLAHPAAYVVLFGLLSPLVLYRGPLNPFGVGIAVFTVLLSAHVLPAAVLVAAIMAVVQVQNVCDPTNTANVWVANYTGVQIVEITKRTLPYQVAVATAACTVTVLASAALFGVRPFASLLPTAQAATLPAGLFSPSNAAGRIAVGDDGSQEARAAVPAIVGALRSAIVNPIQRNETPNASDCSSKSYAAYITATSSSFALIEGVDLDIGVRLFDCGGWIVDEWHDHAVYAQPTDADAQALGRMGAARLLGWAAMHALRWQNLLKVGLAYAPGDPPSYYYALYKTADGNMRAYVRAGGPAYDAGLRTNDVIETLDGLEWWQYGTFQTQARAYDGKPHTFEVLRGGQTLDVQLQAPFPS